MGQKINLITTRMPNHARHSGYDRLIDYIDAQQIISLEDWTFFSRALAKLFKSQIKQSDLQWYHRDNFISEFKAAKRWIAGKHQVFHFLYGENSYRYLGNLKSLNRKNSIIGTYHTPPDRFKEVVRTDKHLYQLDAIITMSRMQNDFFSKYVGQDRTFFIPHGIDVDYFKPAEKVEEKEGPIKCLFVGSHLRDIDTLVDASLLLAQWGEKCEIVAVTSPENKAKIEKSNNITLRTGINDEELLQLYQQSDLLLFPLLAATANNSLLEAMACGLPIVSTDLEGVRDYVNEEAAILVKRKDAKALADAVVQLSEDTKLRVSMGLASREQAMKLSWQSVAKQIHDIYKLVQ